MRNTIYRQMIFCIDTYRTWIEVADDNLYKEHVIPRNNRTDFLVSRTLVLRACKPHGTYDRGMTWTIPEHDLDAALATYRKQNGIFKSRMKKGASSLTAEDTENIIRPPTGLSAWNSWYGPFTYLQNPITCYDLDYITVCVSCNACRPSGTVVQEQTLLHGKILR